MITSPDYKAYLARHAAAEALQAEILPANKAAIFDALVSADIQTITVAFDGCGDSGQIENTTAHDAAGVEHELPNATVAFHQVTFEALATVTQSVGLNEAITMLVFRLLEQVHAGWENNDGAYGEFTFDVANRSIALDYNERFTDSTYYYHEF
jgi:hypothetical protein